MPMKMHVTVPADKTLPCALVMESDASPALRTHYLVDRDHLAQLIRDLQPYLCPP